MNYCPDCKLPIITNELVSRKGTCRCGEFQTYSTSDSSCMEKSLLPKITLTWKYFRDFDTWSCCYGPYHITIENGVDLWIYNGNQCEIYCNDPKEHMKAIRSVL
jgi:hypothetical protein